MSTPISPADLSAMRQAALQQRATTQLGREAKQAATSTPGDAVTLSGKDPAKTGAEVAVHTGVVKNDASGKGTGTTATALGSAPAATTTADPAAAATTADPAAASATSAQAPEFSAGAAGSTLPLGADQSASTGSAPLDPGTSAPASSARQDQANAQKMQQAEEDQVRAIFMQMWADRRKAQAEMWKLIQDTNNKIFEIIQGVAVNRAMSIKKGMDAWAQYILM